MKDDGQEADYEDIEGLDDNALFTLLLTQGKAGYDTHTHEIRCGGMRYGVGEPFRPRRNRRDGAKARRCRVARGGDAGED